MGLTYLDSCVVIDAVANPGARGEQARRALALSGKTSGEGGDETGSETGSETNFVTSPLVELECMVRPLRSGDQQIIQRMRSSLHRFARVAITDRAFELASHIRALHGLSTADALHMATASTAGCAALWTSDQTILRAAPNFAVDPVDLR